MRRWDRIVLASAGLEVSAIGKDYKADPAKVPIKQDDANSGGSTSVRNESDEGLEWKLAGYYQRNRDLGQVFTPEADFTLDAIVLRTGPSDNAVLHGASGAPVFVQFFEVVGTPRINDNGTPPGTDAKHGFSKNHRCDDFLEGVEYRTLKVVEGGRFPTIRPTRDAEDEPTGGDAGKLVYMRWAFTGDDRIKFEAGKRYAFMVGFAEPGRLRGFTMANANMASKPDPPSLNDEHDLYNGGWGLRREGDGTVPPAMILDPTPPDDPAKRRALKAQSLFAEGPGHYALSPTTDGYPDVDIYRDHQFYMEVTDGSGGK